MKSQYSFCSLTLAIVAAASGYVLQANAGETGVIVESETSTPRTLRAYGKPNQTRIWYNNYAQRWDALVPRSDGWWSGADHHVVADVAGRQSFSIIKIGDRDDDRPDVFWDADRGALYVLASHPQRSEFWLIDYDVLTNSYALEVGKPGAGIEVPGLNHPNGRLGGNSPASIFVSPNGKVWASVMRENALLIQYSSDGGRTWLNSPLRLNDNVEVGVTTWSCFENEGNTYAGLFAGENGNPGESTRFFYWYIAQDANPAVPNNWVNESELIPAPFGREQSDDHVSSAVDAAFNQYFAVKTENGDSTDPLIKLYKRTPKGKWFQFAVTKTAEVPEQSRPSIVIDEDRRLLHIYTNGAEVAGEESRTAGRTTASLDALSKFVATTITPIFSAADTVFTDVITPRHRVNNRTGIAVLAHNRSDSAIWFNVDISSGTNVQQTRGSTTQSLCGRGT